MCKMTTLMTPKSKPSSPPPKAVAAVTWRRNRLDSAEIGADADRVSGVKLVVFVSGVLAAIVAAPSGGGQYTTKRCRADPPVDQYAVPWF